MNFGIIVDHGKEIIHRGTDIRTVIDACAGLMRKRINGETGFDHDYEVVQLLGPVVMYFEAKTQEAWRLAQNAPGLSNTISKGKPRMLM